MNNGVITVSAEGAKAMSFSSEFRRYARENGIRDPFEVSRQLFSKRCRKEGTDLIVDIEWDEKTGKIKDDPAEPTRAEKDAYILMRDRYVAKRVFEEIGYNQFLQHTAPDKTYDISDMRVQDEFVPCKSADRQCYMECHRFAECALNGTWKPE